MKNLILFVLILTAQLAIGQKYFSKTGKISFYSEAPMEKIEATNTTASTVLDASTGNVEWAVLIQGFKFEKALMQEHFNENYMESATYPKAKFKGRIDNLSSVNFKKDGDYNVNVSGQLEIHGVTKPVSATGVISIKGGTVSAKSKFSVPVADYGIVIPKLVADNIAKTVDINVQADYQAMPSN
ncbi:MAG TPA: YceI family protein [Saprospiraceae bacterium]|nr:YceI family protein [Saprospiraceae bacterium]